MKSGNFNFLEPFGPPQTCNGTALRLPYRDDGFIKTETYPLQVCDKCVRELKLVNVQF
jgi:hypothetical protein